MNVRSLVEATAVMVLVMLVPARARAVCTAHGTATSAPSQVVPANDIVVDRHYLFIQNTGANPLNFAVGTNNKATTADIYLLPGTSMMMYNYGSPIPNGDISVISSLGTTWAFCDY